MTAFALRLALTAAACLLAWGAWEVAARLPLGPLAGVLGDLRPLAGLALVFLVLTLADGLPARFGPLLRRRLGLFPPTRDNEGT